MPRHRARDAATYSHAAALSSRSAAQVDSTKAMVMEKPSPLLVGREFVRQYYTLLNQAPDMLHRCALKCPGGVCGIALQINTLNRGLEIA